MWSMVSNIATKITPDPEKVWSVCDEQTKKIKTVKYEF